MIMVCCCFLGGSGEGRWRGTIFFFGGGGGGGGGFGGVQNVFKSVCRIVDTLRGMFLVFLGNVLLPEYV